MYENMQWQGTEETRVYPYEGGIEYQEIFPYAEQPQHSREIRENSSRLEQEVQRF